jgi:sodium transport system permease protein
MFRIIYKKELLNFFRDKNTIIYSIILPIVLYPLLFWVMNELMTIHQGFLSDMPSRVAFTSKPPDDILFQIMKSDSDLELSGNPIPLQDGRLPNLKQKSIDAIIDVSCFTNEIRIFFDSSSDRSGSAKARVESALEEYRIRQLHDFSGVGEGNRPEMRFVDIDLSTLESRSRFILGMLLPMLVIIITVMGGMYPSIEVITAERERKTLETTMVAPIKPGHLIGGKFLAVITMSTLAGVLNIFAMVLTLRHTLFGGADDSLQFTLPWSALPLMLLGIVMIAATFNSLMILVCAFAKDFKEAQSYVSPIYAIGIQPAVVAVIPGVPFNNLTALIPITNISLFFRALIQERVEVVPSIITLGSLLLWCMLLLLAARKILGRDALVMGLKKFSFKALIFGNKNKKGDASD